MTSLLEGQLVKGLKYLLVRVEAVELGFIAYLFAYVNKFFCIIFIYYL